MRLNIDFSSNVDIFCFKDIKNDTHEMIIFMDESIMFSKKKILKVSYHYSYLLSLLSLF